MNRDVSNMKSQIPLTPSAADTEGLWHDPASAGIRKEFHLPPGGPFTG